MHAPPPAVAPRDDADGWGAIDAVDVVDCAVSVFQMAQDLGGRDQEWVIAVGDALALWERGDERGVERGLKWFLILPQLLLRKASRGGKRGRGELNSRFRAWRERRKKAARAAQFSLSGGSPRRCHTHAWQRCSHAQCESQRCSSKQTCQW